MDALTLQQEQSDTGLMTKLKMFTIWYFMKKLVRPWFKPIRLTSFLPVNWLRDGQKPTHKRSTMLFPQAIVTTSSWSRRKCKIFVGWLGEEEKALVLGNMTCT